MKRRVTDRQLAEDFKRGVSFLGLARKYGMTKRQAEDRIRRWCNR